jgi:DNA uptake protein ComE-like DNA-binding protein
VPGTGPMSGLSALGRGQILKVVDLNSATLVELQTLPGITQSYATKIVASRPYHSLEEVERAGVPRDILQQIMPPAIIKITGHGPPPQ